MNGLLVGLAVILTLVSGALLYAASPSARGRRGYASRLAIAASALAVIALAAWIPVLGIGAGICAMLTCWMVSMVASPWLALVLVLGHRANSVRQH